MAIAAVNASLKTNVGVIVVLTTTGRSAHLVSKYRPRCPIIAVTRNAQAARQCHLYRGILPCHYDKPADGDWTKDVEERIQIGVSLAKQVGIIKGGDMVVVVTGSKQGPGSTNSMRIITAN